MIFERVKKVMADQLNIGEEEIKLESNLAEELKLDSLELFEAVIALEEEFDIEIPNEDIEEIKTVKEIVDYIEQKLK